MDSNLVKAFGERAECYENSRPGYPGRIAEWLAGEGALSSSTVVADIGAGTGKLGISLARYAASVIFVEPSDKMSEYIKKSGYRVVNASAEKTTLPDRSVDLIVCGQSFHFFDRAKVKKEFARILAPGGRVCLVWYLLSSRNPFIRRYEEILSQFTSETHNLHEPDLVELHRLDDFFSPKGFSSTSFQISIRYNIKKFLELTHSFSYLPANSREEADKQLIELFKEFQKESYLEICYSYYIYLGAKGTFELESGITE